MAKDSLKKNYFYNLICQMLNIIMPLVTTPYLSRVLGAENIGIFGYTLSITTYFVLAGCLGTSLYGQREIAYVQDNLKVRTKKFYEIMLIKFGAIILSITIFVFFFTRAGIYSVYYKILILEILANFLDINWFFQGLELFKKTAYRNLVFKTLGTVFTFLLVKSSSDLFTYILIYVLANLVGNLSMWLYLPKYLINIKSIKLELKSHIKPIAMLFIPQIAMQIYLVLDKTMIGLLLKDMSEVGYYEQAQKAVKALIVIVTSLSTVMSSKIAAIYSKAKDEKEIKKNLCISIDFVKFIAIPLMFGVAAISTSVVPLFYGPGYDEIKKLLIVFCPMIIAIGFSNITGIQYLIQTGKEKQFTISVVIGAVINVILNVFFIINYKAIGAAIASVIAEFSILFIHLKYAKNVIKINDIFNNLWKYVLGSSIMFLVIRIIIKCVQVTVTNLIFEIFAGAFTYILFLILIKDDFVYLKTKKVFFKILKK